MRKQVLGSLVAFSIFFVAPHAWAGHPRERQGFWIGFGGGYGSADVSCDGCDGDSREGSFTGLIKLGGTLNERVLLGFEGNGWLKEEEGTTVTLGSGTFTVTCYPQASSGFFLKAGAGFSYIDTSFNLGSLDASVSKTGWGVLAGAGYDIRVGRNFSLTPCVNFHYGKPGDLSFEGETLGSGGAGDATSSRLEQTRPGASSGPRDPAGRPRKVSV